MYVCKVWLCATYNDQPIFHVSIYIMMMSFPFSFTSVISLLCTDSSSFVPSLCTHTHAYTCWPFGLARHCVIYWYNYLHELSWPVSIRDPSTLHPHDIGERPSIHDCQPLITTSDQYLNDPPTEPWVRRKEERAYRSIKSSLDKRNLVLDRV